MFSLPLYRPELTPHRFPFYIGYKTPVDYVGESSGVYIKGKCRGCPSSRRQCPLPERDC